MPYQYDEYEKRQKETRRREEKKRREDLELSARVYNQNLEYFRSRDEQHRAESERLSQERMRAQKSTTQGGAGSDDPLIVKVLAGLFTPIVIGALLGSVLDLSKLLALVAIWGVVAILMGILIYLHSKSFRELRTRASLIFYLGLIAGLAILITVGWLLAINEK